MKIITNFCVQLDMDSIQYASAKKKLTLYWNILQASIEEENKNEFTHMKEAMYSSLKAHLLGREEFEWRIKQLGTRKFYHFLEL